MIHIFSVQEEPFVYDSESGALHEIDEAALSVLRLYEVQNGARPSSAQLLSAGPHAHDIADEIDDLIEAGELFAPQPDVAFEQVYPEAPRFKAMCLNICHDCNMRCAYCFADTGEYGIGHRAMMSAETGRRAIDFLIRSSGPRHHLDIDFFGGEPLMNWDVVRELVEYCETEGPKHDKDIRLTITTNATLLNDERIDYINRHFKNCVLSLDGRREINDRMRYDAAGKGTYDRVARMIKKFVARRGDKEYYIRGTFTSHNLDFDKDAEVLAELGANVSVEPVIAPPSAEYALRPEHLPTIAESYERLAVNLWNRQQDGHPYHFFHFMLQDDHAPCLFKRLKGCGVGTEYCAVTPEGDIYPCHQLVGETAYRIGRLTPEGAMIDKKRQKPFLEALMPQREECTQCWARYYCGGGCAANHLHSQGDLNRTDPMYCAMVQKRLECALWLSSKRIKESAARASNR